MPLRHKVYAVITFIVAFIVIAVPLQAQNSLVNQTVNKAKMLRNQKRFGEAAQVLGNFEKKYPGNLWVEQLYAQTLFWMKDYRRAERIYRRAIGFHPNDLTLKYDYAVMLYAENRLNDAKNQLQNYLRLKPDDAKVQAFLGKILYYQGNVHQAEKHLKEAVRLHPGDQKTEQLYREVYRIVQPQLTVKADFMSDDQPMQALGATLRFGWFVSNGLDFDLSGNAFNYSQIANPGLITRAEIGNRFHFPKAKMELRLSGAWFYANSTQTQDWGGSANLKKKFGKYFGVTLDARRTNYSYTTASVNDNLLMMDQYSLDFTLGKSNGWNGMAGGRYQFFSDDNYVNAFYLWFLSKPLDISGLKLSFGYAFNYMDSKEDRFVPKTTMNANIDTTQTIQVEGIYVPYYTPHNQYANSVLVNFNYHFSPYAAIYGHASIGVYSQTKAPGYVLYDFQYIKSFSYQSYTPLDLGLSFHTDISRKVSLSLSYNYLQTYYYSSHNVHFVFKYYF